MLNISEELLKDLGPIAPRPKPKARDADDVPSFKRLSFVPEIKAIDTDARTVDHRISSNAIDRAGDIVEPAGWDFKQFQRNPIVLADHRYEIGAIIGRAESLRVSKNGVDATTRFDEIGIGAQAFRLISEGFLKAFSVGFKPTKAHSIRNGADAKCRACVAARDSQLDGKTPEEIERIWVRGVHFLEQELLEYSAVAVPMNPDAVLNCVTNGLIERDSVSMFFSVDRDADAVETLIAKILNAESPSHDAPKAKATPREKEVFNVLSYLERDADLRDVTDTLREEE